MDDLHAATIDSGPTSETASNGGYVDKLSLNELMAQKERVEGELIALSGVLDSHGVNMNTSLTTFDGYPRADLDIAPIRTTRARIIRLRNDYKTLMSRIEVGLHDHFASLPATETHLERDDAVAARDPHLPARSDPSPSLIETPFAKVNSVEPGSPAAEAGLKVGDEIRRFGSINWINHEKLTKVAQEVQRNEGRPIMVKVLRRGSAEQLQAQEELQVQLVPRRDWGGRGMLGCHLLTT
ncbi:MAG: hypothetical protein M1819_002371 [Sarea resinae]|nr:MAG: hypothetical protein M1819_002371 [Sarea resinae]